MRLNVPTPYLPVRGRRLPDAVGQVRVRVGAHARDGARSRCRRSRRRTNSRRRSGTRGALSAHAHLVAGAPVLELDLRQHRRRCRRGAREPECLLHPRRRRAARHRGRRARWWCTTTAARSPRWRAWRTRSAPGVVWAPSIWWGKLAADGANANQTTSQRETDMGHGPVFYDNLVEVGLAD